MTALVAPLDSVALALVWARHQLATAGIEQPQRDARLLLASALELPMAQILGWPERVVSVEEERRLRNLVARRVAREPVSRILGRREFWGLELAISPDTLDPRPDSETLVEAVLKRLPDRQAPLRILDLGTGSGCLLLALLSELPQAEGLGLDLLPGAIAVAESNAAALELSPRARFAVADWRDGLSETWQAIVSNPPYIIEQEISGLSPEVALYDPRVALSGGQDGLAAYRELAALAPDALTEAGLLALEVGLGQADDVEALIAATGLQLEGRARDLSGIVRCVLARKPMESKKNSWKAT